jgi:hypothetical protein
MWKFAQWGHVIDEYSYNTMGAFFFPNINDPLGISLENIGSLLIIKHRMLNITIDNFFIIG